MINEANVAGTLRHLLEATQEVDEVYNALDADGVELTVALTHVRTYAEAGMLTRDAGFVVYLEDGTEFQVTVVQRR